MNLKFRKNILRIIKIKSLPKTEKVMVPRKWVISTQELGEPTLIGYLLRRTQTLKFCAKHPRLLDVVS